MKKIIKLTESDLAQIIKKVLTEQKVENINPKNLKFGDRGDSVKTLQKLLMDRGYLRTDSMVPTGFFGKLTDAALKSFLSGGVPLTVTPPFLKGQQPVKPNQQTTKGKLQGNAGQANVKQQSTVKTSYTFTPRIDQELQFIKQRGLGDSPFFIYDPKDNLIFLFENADKFVAKTHVVDGADMQKEQSSGEEMTQDKWCQLSGLESKPHKCTVPNTKEFKKPSYSLLASLKARFLPKGIYKISALAREEGYTGSGQNVWGLTDTKTGKRHQAAIHGVPNIPQRLTASADLEKVLKSDISSGIVPQEYLNDIKTIANANQSYGCVGVPAKFVDNPQVKAILEGGDKWYKKSVRVFVMGDTGKDYLAQNSVEFFDKLSGNGQSCINPESLASRMSNVA